MEERRRSERYPIDEELRYRVLEPRGKYRMGNGRTLDMSSSGVRFHTEESLRIGERLEMAMNWPASLDGNCRLMKIGL